MSNYFKPLPEKYPNLYYNEDIPNIFIIPKGHCRNVVWYKKDENGFETHYYCTFKLDNLHKISE